VLKKYGKAAYQAGLKARILAMKAMEFLPGQVTTIVLPLPAS
jgi:hypothetical protein